MTLKRFIIMSMVSAVSFSSFDIYGQNEDYRWNVGAKVGMSGYLGEYASGNMFSSPGFAGVITGAYNLDSRWDFSANVSFLTVSGDANNIGGYYPESLPSSFNATMAGLNFRAEFNFFPYGIGETYKGLKNWTPYLAAGVGVVMGKTKGFGTIVAPEIPLALGIRYKIKKRLNFIGELSFTKTFTDKIDGAKDIYGIKSGWFKNTDWYAAIVVGLTYEFGERCPTCHYVE